MSRHVPHPKATAVGLDALAADEQSETQTAAVFAPLLKGAEQLLGLSRRQAPALVPDLDQDTVRGGRGAEEDVSPRQGELGGVVHQIGDRPRYDLPIDLYLHAAI